jgi:hypothetical protein
MEKKTKANEIIDLVNEKLNRANYGKEIDYSQIDVPEYNTNEFKKFLCHLYSAASFAEILDFMIFDFTAIYGETIPGRAPVNNTDFADYINCLKCLRNLFIKTALDNSETVTFGSYSEH